MDEIVLTFDEETGAFTEKKEPYCTVEFATKEDFDFFKAAIKFYHEHLEKAAEDILRKYGWAEVRVTSVREAPEGD